MYLDLLEREHDYRDVYRLCISFIVPRPIALVSTVSADGRHNLAPFSFYNMVCANPPVVMFCPGTSRDLTPKDSFVNVETTGEFVIATVNEPMADAMVRTAAELPFGTSEFEFSGLTPGPARRVKPPLVMESPVNIECTLRQIVKLGEGPGSGRVVFGNIVALHVRDDLVTADGTVDPCRLRAVGRLGGHGYCTVTEPYELRIPRV